MWLIFFRQVFYRLFFTTNIFSQLFFSTKHCLWPIFYFSCFFEIFFQSIPNKTDHLLDIPWHKHLCTFNFVWKRVVLILYWAQCNTVHTTESVSIKMVFLFFSLTYLKRAILKGYEYPNYFTISLIKLLHYNICISQTPCSWNRVIWLPPSFTWVIFPSNARNHIRICDIKKTHFG